MSIRKEFEHRGEKLLVQAEAKGEGVFRILALGDSLTYGDDASFVCNDAGCK